MDRARRAGWTVLIVVAMVACSRVAEAGERSPWCRPGRRPRSWSRRSRRAVASASDEFVELANQGATPVDLQGLEIVYATSTGSTVTRKATWTVPTILDPGRRILIANAAGALRRARRCHLLGWLRGDRRGGRAARRRRGGDRCRRLGRRDERVRRGQRGAGAAGRIQPRASPGRIGRATAPTPMTTSSDWFVQGTPSPQGLGSPPVPGPVPTPSADARGTPTPTPTFSPSPTRADADADRDADRRADADPGADGHARPRRLRHRPRPAPTSTPTPPPTPAPTSDADGHPDADAEPRRDRGRPDDARWRHGHDRGRPDDRARRARVRPRRLHPGCVGRDRALSRRRRCGELAGRQHDHGRGLAVESVFAANAAGLREGYQAGPTGRPSGCDGSGDRSRGRGG